MSRIFNFQPKRKPAQEPEPLQLHAYAEGLSSTARHLRRELQSLMDGLGYIEACAEHLSNELRKQQ